MPETNSCTGVGESLSLLCEKHHLRGYRDEIAAVVRPALDIISTPSSMDEIAIGESRFGGLPDLPTKSGGLCWNGTYWPEENGQAPEFFAQFDLKQLHAFEACTLLPSTGSLLFFFANSEKTGRGHRVIYTNEEQLHRPTEAWELPDNLRYRPAKLTFRESWKLPYPGHSSIQSLELGEEGLEHYNLMYRDWRNFYGICLKGAPSSWLFGYEDRYNCPENPEPEPGDSLAKEVGKRGWINLLQIADDESLDMRIGDFGLLSFHIHPEHLAITDFDNCFWDMEST